MLFFVVGRFSRKRNLFFFETMKILESFVESVEGLRDGSFAVASAAVDVAVEFDVAPLAEDETSRVHSQKGENLKKN